MKQKSFLATLAEDISITLIKRALIKSEVGIPISQSTNATATQNIRTDLKMLELRNIRLQYFQNVLVTSSYIIPDM